ncbi:restriction endonuclease subunit S [Mycoplasma phocimorsus]|uniref:restriction endonuclease subunit S n=1 Tax=Mycoplasma phocimorsus TaxID=3045839 RepID=UPI0024C017ED|nr:restriction endonuclease subunit S [Mycoplasma phocimorsus]MDJ1647713.1 restriction endonuclease subunit S [Mycoplasma phocimorsus]
MNKNIFKLIEEMVEQNKIEYKTIGEIANIEIGKQLNKSLLISNGKYPVINGGVKPSGYWNEFNYKKGAITVIQGGPNAGYSQYMETDFWAGAHSYILNSIDENVVSQKFLFYILKINESTLNSLKQGQILPSLKRESIKNFVIPVPPIEIQEKIANILDKFSTLKTELEIEIKKRALQYNYYCDELLKLDNISENKYLKKLLPNYLEQKIKKTEYKTIGEIANIEIGKQLNKSLLISNGKYPVINGGVKPSGYWNEFNYKKGAITVIQGGPNAGYSQYMETDFWAGAHSYILNSIDENVVSQKFLFYILKINESTLNSLKQGQILPSLKRESIKNFVIPVLSIEIQNTIANLLDKLQEYSQNIQGLLPKEIELREKQYQYYLNRLLDFARKK